jgi:hypothetical protein
MSVEEKSFDESFAQAERGESVSDEQIRAFWAKHRLRGSVSRRARLPSFRTSSLTSTTIPHSADETSKVAFTR